MSCFWPIIQPTKALQGASWLLTDSAPLPGHSWGAVTESSGWPEAAP